jgi:hypothetical protein
MRTLVILLLAVIIGLFTSQQGVSGSVTVYQGGKVYTGWADDNGKVIIKNEWGKTVITGWFNKMGGIILYDDRTDDNYQGKVNSFGKCTLTSDKGTFLRIEIER